MRCRRAFCLAIATAALAACGDLLGADDETPAPLRPNEAGANDVGLPGDDGGAEGEAAVDGGACTANGSLDLDPAFAPATGLIAARAAMSSAGDVAVVGRCGDGGVGLEMVLVSASGAVNRVPSCFGSASVETVVSAARTTSGYVVATNRLDGVLKARATHVSATGADLSTEELAPVSGYNASYAKFAVQVGTTIVWGGLRTQFSTPDRGFLKVMTKSAIEFPPGEVPVSATVSNGSLYVAIIRAIDGSSQQELFVRRYEIGAGGNLVEDITFASSNTLTLDVAFTTVDGVGAMLVDGDTVTVAAGFGASTRLLRLTKGTWTQELVPVFSPARIVRSCDGTVIVAGHAYLDGSASPERGLVRRANGATAGELEMPTPDDVTDLLREPNGDLFVVQAAGTVRRVSP